MQCTLVGSILSNLLLVLGCSFLAGGYYYDQQTYNQQGAKLQNSLLVRVFANVSSLRLSSLIEFVELPISLS